MTAQDRLVSLLGYVKRMAAISERAVFRLAEYQRQNMLIIYEQELKGQVGIHHDIADGDEALWLKIDRLKRRDPPPVPDDLMPWLTVSRNPNKEPHVAEYRVEMLPVEEIEVLLASGRVHREDVMDAQLPPEGDSRSFKDVVFRLEGDEELKQAIEMYLERVWRPWAEEEKPRRATIKIYDAFFNLQQAIETQDIERPLETVWGIGVASWNHPKGEIYYPLIEQLVEIEISDIDGAIRIRPRSNEPTVALGPYQQHGLAGADAVFAFAREHFRKLNSGAEEVELSPFVQPSFEPVLRYAVANLDPSGVFWPDMADDTTDRTVPPPGENLCVTNSWVIYSRPRSANFIIEDIEKLTDAVEGVENENDLPPAGKRLVTEPDDTPPSGQIDLSSGFGATLIEQTETLTQAATIDDRQLYFPKAFNEEQVEIVRRLERTDGMVVQGPPGTGKTHTIANIICHYMATGKRVLVTSHGEAALTVLRDHIPEEVRELVISLLSSEREGLKQLERAVGMLANRVADISPSEYARKIEEGEARILELKERIAGIDVELKSWAKKHLTKVGAKENELLPWELAEKVVMGRSKHAWFKDRPAHGQGPLFTTDEVDLLRRARKKVAGNLSYIGSRLPSVSNLPDVATLTAAHEDLANAQRIIDQQTRGDLPQMAVGIENAMERAQAARDDLAALVEALVGHTENSWLGKLYKAWLEKSDVAVGFDEVLRLMHSIAEARRELLMQPVTAPALLFAEPQVREEIRKALTSASRGERPFGLVSLGKSRAKTLYGQIEVDGASVTSADGDAARQALRYIEWREKISRLIRRWNAIAGDLDLPDLEHDGESCGRWVSETYVKVEAQKRAALELVPRLKSELSELFPYGIDTRAVGESVESARRILDALKLNLSRHRLEASRNAVRTLIEQLHDYDGDIVDRMRSFLRDGIGNGDLESRAVARTWDDFCSELARLREHKESFNVIRDLSEKIETSGAPDWALRLRSEPISGIDDPLTPASWLESWRWAQQYSYLRSIDGRERVRGLSEQRIQAEAEIKRTFTEIVRLRTFLALSNSLSDRVKAALIQFTTAIRHIGRGTGIRARRFRRDARDAMERSYSAVPCWIMPTWRASESLPPHLGSFDLVIIDESSQSDVRAIPAILRGKKVLVVGDDKQVSPSAVGVEERRILQLRKNFLEDQPFKSMLAPGMSLYDLMSAIYPGDRIMLKEHFRCVEPIIRFSAKEFYNNELIPLRIPEASKRLDPALIDIYVANGIKEGQLNRAEANAIVDEIVSIVNDQTFDRRSIGVVSLLGRHQAALIQTMLLERIGEEAFVNHRIACGDSATFQGKERDIMFISVVEAQDPRAKRSLIFQQRYNVALSRARDRMYLVRSVSEEQLRPDDLKAKVIRHFKNPMEGVAKIPDDAVELCESPFEVEVYKRLVAGGYRVRPQIKAGGYSIDLVVEGTGDRRLAIELDGDKYHGPERWAEDYARQMALERVGWTFWRCWGSSWKLDPDDCFRDLVGRLAGLGIEPLGSEGVATVFTEHRVIGLPERSLRHGAPGTRRYPDELDVPPPQVITAEARTAETRDDDRAASVAGSDAVIEGYEAEADRVVGVGDKVVIIYNDEPSRHRTLLISAESDDPDMGVLHKSKPISQALLGMGEQDEVEIPAGGGTQSVTILKIESAA